MIKSILVHASQEASAAAKSKKRSFPSSSPQSDPFRPRLLTNLRTYYARRRPTMMVSSSTSTTTASSRVRFQLETNQVYHVPSHRAFSATEKRAIWTGRKELKRLLQKNHAEYAYEKKNTSSCSSYWKDAPEEDAFVPDQDGQPQHPVYATATSTATTKSPTAQVPKNTSTTTTMPSEQQRPRRKILRRRRLPMSTAAVVVSDSSSEDEEDEGLHDRKRARTE